MSMPAAHHTPTDGLRRLWSRHSQIHPGKQL